MRSLVIFLGCAICTNLLPMAHENMTYWPKWPVKILDGAKFYPDCTEIKNVIFQFSIQACCKKLSGVCIRMVTGRFAPKTFPPWLFPPWSFHLYFSPLVVSPPCPSRFTPKPFPPLVVRPPTIEKR